MVAVKPQRAVHAANEQNDVRTSGFRCMAATSE